MRQSAELRAEGVGVVALFFAPAGRLARYRAHFGIPETVPLLADEGRDVYRTYGMRVGSMADIYGPDTLKQYADYLGLSLPDAMRQFYLPKPGKQFTEMTRNGRTVRLKADEDTRQLGGDVVVGPDGRVLFAHCSRNQADRPAVAAIVAAVRASQGEGG